jgi:hypothetical protein
MIDAKRYTRLKPKGVTSIINENGETYLCFKRFSVEDASEIPPEKQLVEIDKINDRRNELIAELTSIDAFLQDLIEWQQLS